MPPRISTCRPASRSRSENLRDLKQGGGDDDHKQDSDHDGGNRAHHATLVEVLSQNARAILLGIMANEGQDIVGEGFVEFITRADCPLCEKGDEVLRSAAKRWGLAIRRIDVDAVPALHEEFSARVPVIRSAGGAVIDEGRISALRVNAGLMKLRTTRLG